MNSEHCEHLNRYIQQAKDRLADGEDPRYWAGAYDALTTYAEFLSRMNESPPKDYQTTCPGGDRCQCIPEPSAIALAGKLQLSLVGV